MQELHPGIGDLDPFLLIILVIGLEALAVGMHDDLGDLVWEDRVCHIPEVLPLALATLRIDVREVGFHLVVLEQLRVHGLDGDLVVLPQLHMLDLLLTKQMLPPCNDSLHIILGDMLLREDIELLQTNKD